MFHPQRIEPGPGQESVWDYPRPPRLERFHGHIVVVLGGVTLVDTRGAYRVLETSHPPNYYFPRADVNMDHFRSVRGGSFCEWKGNASYFDVKVGNRRLERAAWSYTDPTARFAEIAGYIACYAAPMDSCTVDGEQVTPQPGGFYGGWITKNVVGPFKGGPGSMFW